MECHSLLASNRIELLGLLERGGIFYADGEVSCVGRRLVTCVFTNCVCELETVEQ